mmetsp:Transcript_35591/g.79070  ORF Transcript_35591/g.79070 Transcript_35591/m.79070 type:complete len:273 (+) Transcript_35591:3147-3965(+)
MRRPSPAVVVVPPLTTMNMSDRMALQKALQKVSMSQPGRPGVLVQPSCHSLADVMELILQVGDAAGAPQPAALLVDQLRSRLRRATASAAALRSRQQNATATSLKGTSVGSQAQSRSPRVLVLESLFPMVRAGYWVPEVLQLLGVGAPDAAPGDEAHSMTWEQVRELAPDVLVISNDLDQALYQMGEAAGLPGWWSLPAVKAGQVYLFHCSLVTKPGPRLIEGVEALLKVLYPNARPVPNGPVGGAVLKLSLYGGQRCRQRLLPNYFLPCWD